MLRMDLKYKKKVLFIKLEGQLDKCTAYKLHNYLIPTIKENHIKYIVFDLSLLETLDKSGIEALTNVKKIVNENKGLVCLCGYNKNLNKYINKTKIDVINERDIYKLIEA